MAGRFKFFEGPDGSPTGRPAALVRITDDAGVVGWGESVPIPKWSEETLETVTTTLVRYLAPELVGRDCADIDGAHAVMDHAIAPSFSTGQPIAKAGIDLALHDLLGKRLGVTLPKLWQRTPADALTLSWTVSPAKLEDIEPLVAAGREKGYEHFNVKVGTTPDFDVELCRRVRALAPAHVPVGRRELRVRRRDGLEGGAPARGCRRGRPRSADSPEPHPGVSGASSAARVADPHGRRHRVAGGARRVPPSGYARWRGDEAVTMWRAGARAAPDRDPARRRPDVARQRADRSRRVARRDAWRCTPRLRKDARAR